MKRILLFLSLYCCTESCQSPFTPDLVVVESEIGSLSNQPEEGYIINQGTFDRTNTSPIWEAVTQLYSS